MTHKKHNQGGGGKDKLNNLMTKDKEALKSV